MFIFKLTYKKPLEEVEKYLAEHRKFLDKYYESGKLVASGPREPRIGGVILCNSASIDEAKQIISNDPFSIHEIADYEITQFHVTKHSIPNFEASFE